MLYTPFSSPFKERGRSLVFAVLLVLIFKNCAKMCHIKVAPLTILCVQFGGINYSHAVVRPPPPPVFRSLSHLKQKLSSHQAVANPCSALLRPWQPRASTSCLYKSDPTPGPAAWQPLGTRAHSAQLMGCGQTCCEVVTLTLTYLVWGSRACGPSFPR